jgi:hypothetical protein
MHPYTKRLLGLLGDDDPIAALASGPARADALFAAVRRAGFDRAWEPGKWTGRQIFAHLAATEVGVGFRLRQALSEPRHRVQAFDQDAWIVRDGGGDPEVALASYKALRAFNLQLVRKLTPEDLARPVDHPERGVESVDLIVRMLAGHDRNHFAQLEKAARA